LNSPHVSKTTAYRGPSSPSSPALPLQINRLLASNAVSLPAGRMTIAQVDKLLGATKMTTTERMNVKSALARAGLID
jgi:hypothetical protein